MRQRKPKAFAAMQVFAPDDVAALIRVGRQAILREMDAGSLKASCVPGTRNRRVFRADLVEYLANRPDLHFASPELVGPMPAWEEARDGERCPLGRWPR